MMPIDYKIDLSVCTWLHRLTIVDCDIKQLPPSISMLTDLNQLELHNNRLTSIDSIDFVTMSKLTSLLVRKSFQSRMLSLNKLFVLLADLLESTWPVVEWELEQCHIANPTQRFWQ
jgi:Leucine-rich repeat (LRR) protein